MFPSLYDIIDPVKINSLRNGMTVTYSFHRAFGNFKFGLKQIVSHLMGFKMNWGLTPSLEWR